jgi:hypothetical protein
MPNERLLDGYLTRTKMAQEINRGVRTLERWENQRIGPPVTYIGKTPMYRIEAVRAWLLTLERNQAHEESQ